MKRKFVIGLSLLCILIISIAAYLTYKTKNFNISYESYGDNYFKEFGITLKSANMEPKISKREILKITENMLKTFTSKPKKIYLEYRLMTWESFSFNNFSQEVIDANPMLKDKGKLEDIPVWIITFDRLLPDDFKSEKSPGKQPLDVVNIVVDAATGKGLSSFGSGRKPEQ